MDDAYPYDAESWEQIEQFLSGNMPASEEAAFRERLAQDQALQQATTEARLLLIGVQQPQLEKKLNRFHAEMELKNKATKGTLKRLTPGIRWAIAASIIISLSLAAYFVIAGESPEAKLYARYYQPEPGLVSSMGTSNDYNFDRGMVDYKQGQYKAAILQWMPLVSSQPENDTLNYFIACAYMADKAAKDAIPYFEKIITTNSSSFLYDAYWYLGLAYLRTGDREKAIHAIEKSEHVQRINLLQKLKE